jgi:hypothetical protein
MQHASAGGPPRRESPTGAHHGPLVRLLLQAVELIRYPHAPSIGYSGCRRGRKRSPLEAAQRSLRQHGTRRRLLSLAHRFDQRIVRAIVEKAKYTKLLATESITQVLLQRWEKVLRQWLNAVNPLVLRQSTEDGSRL